MGTEGTTGGVRIILGVAVEREGSGSCQWRQLERGEESRVVPDQLYILPRGTFANEREYTDEGFKNIQIKGMRGRSAYRQYKVWFQIALCLAFSCLIS